MRILLQVCNGIKTLREEKVLEEALDDEITFCFVVKVFILP